MKEIARKLAETALEIKAIKLAPTEPFTWASGYRMPIYNDNRLLLGNAAHRALVVDGFEELYRSLKLNVQAVAGIATGGIPPATTLADRLELPLVYVRGQSKGHGLQNQIEGGATSGKQVLVIEDLISTGGSSVSAIEALQAAGASVPACFSIFSYGFEAANEQFERINCSAHPLLTFKTLLEVASEKAYITAEEKALLELWRAAPFEWGEKQSFPKRV